MAAAVSNFVVAEPRPTTLIALWPGNRPPSREGVLEAVRSSGLIELEAMREPEGEEDVLWAAGVDVANEDQPIIIWCEAAKPIPKEALDDPSAASCRWVVGLQTTLERDRALDDLVRTHRLMDAMAPQAPAILDLETGIWRSRASLERLFLAPEPGATEEALWTIHAVREDVPAAAPGWLHTHGLWRCGAPELEMLEVPRGHERAAALLINAVGARLLEWEAIEAGQLIPIGPEIDVVLQPWQEVVKTIEDGALGGLKDRGGDADDPHRGVRAVICAPKSRGVFRKLWTWPEDAVRMLERDDAVLYRSSAATEREALLARSGWPTLAGLGRLIELSPGPEAVHTGEAHCVVKAGFTGGEPDDGGREHLWFIIRRFEGDRALGRLINQPQFIADLREGDERWIDADIVSGWRLTLRGEVLGPGDRAALAKLREDIESMAAP
jgi:hypothetical protein